MEISFRHISVSLLFFVGFLLNAQELPPTVSEHDKNWVSSISYDLSGTTISKSVSYYNDLSKAIQGQSWDIKTQKVWASTTLYDYQGRPALQTSSAPIGSTFGLNTSNFILDNSNGSYTELDFEGSYENNPKMVSTNSKLGAFYSSSNGDDYQDITSYPFSRTVYSELTPGTVKKVLGGNKVNGQWLQGYIFSMPAAQELSKPNAFNNATYTSRRVTKTVSRDVNGVEAVIFTDSDGNTLAAARSGNEENAGQQKYSMTSTIKEQGFVDFHIPVGCTGFSVSNATGHTVYAFNLVTELYEDAAYSGLPSGFYRIAVSNSDTYQYDPNNPITVTYDVNYYDYSLNTYDKVGRLLKSTQPLGTDMESTFKYNSLGQLLKTTSPDEGEARFVYRKDGQIRLSRNSKQKAAKEFSYTNYDVLGRPVESGVYYGADYNPDTYTNNGDTDYYNWFSDELLAIADAEDGLNNSQGKEQHYTLYDIPDAELQEYLEKCGLPSKEYKQSFLYGNVSKIFTDRPYTTSTWYSYDVYGRVKWIVQDIRGLDCLKTIDYSYDAATGQVTKVDYQRHSKTERFVHDYEYNNAGQLVGVNTSRDGENYTNNAKYYYNQTGALVRTEIAEDLQGIDYVYNLNGQLKAINSPQSSGFRDPGKDGISNSFKPDVFGMILDYHGEDFTRNAAHLQGLKNTSTNDQLNGNIGSIRWNNDTPTSSSQTDTYRYSYNKSNWLTRASYGTSSQSGGSVQFAENTNKDYEVSNITYDENGNIKTLKRNGVTDGSGDNKMDDFTYHYENGKNQLTSVEDDNDNSNPDRFNDLKNQDADNYVYNNIGQLETNLQDEINYEYNASGLVTKINGFSENNTGTWATTYFNDFTDATSADAAPWTYDSGIPGINYNAIYAANRDNRCGYLSFNYGGSLSMLLNGNKIATRRFNVLPDVVHKLSLDMIAKQSAPLSSTTGVPVQQPIGFHVRLKTSTGTILASATVNQNLDFIDDPDFPGGGGPIESGCSYFYDEHITLDFTTSEDGIEIEIEAITNGVNAQLYADNIQIEAATTPKLAFYYNDRGQRVRKEVYQGQNTFTSYYVRDAAGSPMAIYNKGEGKTIKQPLAMKELPVYGASRLGVFYNQPESKDGGQYVYQLTDHLGNVRAVVTKVGDNSLSLTNKTDYYPFGMPMPNRNVEGDYRYKFQGQEKDTETEKEAFELRLWDARIGRWLKPDPMRQYHSPYLGMGNIPSSAFDADGGYVYIMGSNGELLRVYNKVMGTEIGESAIDYFINNPDKHVIISATSTSTFGAGGATFYVGNYSKTTSYSSSKANYLMKNYSSDDKKKYNTYFKSFVGAKLQPGDNYIIGLDPKHNSTPFGLEAAFHELYAHVYAREVLGIKNTTSNPEAQHFLIGGSENGTFNNMPKENRQGPPFTQYPIEQFYNSDVMFLEEGGVFLGDILFDVGRMGTLIFGEKVGGATKIESINGPFPEHNYMTPDMYKDF